MITFLFWNINKKPLHHVVTNLVQKYNVDILMLAESKLLPIELLVSLNSLGKNRFQHAPGECKKIQIFTNFSRNFIKPVQEENRITVRHLKLPGLTDVLLAVTHFPSKMNWTPESQAQECSNLIDTIKLKECDLGHTRTVLVGDLNMNREFRATNLSKCLYTINTIKYYEFVYEFLP